MKRMSMATRKYLTAAIARRYKKERRAEKSRLLDEFVLISGYHRKHAMRLLRADGEDHPVSEKPRRRAYDDAARSALALLS